MSDRDIVEKLAFVQRQWASRGYSIEAFLCEKAHAEILRLRALLQSQGDANDNQRMELLSENERLRAELSEARDKALEEAASIARTYQWSEKEPAWAVIQNAILQARSRND